MVQPLDELGRSARLHNFFSELEKEGGKGAKDVLHELLTVKPEDILRDATAMKLMSEWLSEKELKEFVDTGELVIKSKLYENRTYKITGARHDLTQVLDNGKHVEDLCIHTKDNRDFPIADSLLTKIISLKTDERLFLQKANARAADIYRDNGPGIRSNTVQVQVRPARDALFARMSSFALYDLGLASTPPKTPSIPDQLWKDSMRCVAAQALLDAIAPAPQSLCVRGIMPDQDFNMPVARHWRQPAVGDYLRPVDASTDSFYAYRTSVNSYNDRKCMIIYGFSHLALEPHCVAWIEFRRMNGAKIVDRIDVSHIHKTDAIAMTTPIMFKRHDDAQIVFHLTDQAAGHHSRIQILGAVAEPIGMTLCG